MRQVKLEKVMDVYSIDEMLADPDKKKKLLEFNQPSEAEEGFIMEDELRDLTLWLESLGFKEVEIHYDLSCCQGSGASFSFESVDIDSLIDKYPDRKLAEQLDNVRLDGFRSTLNYLLSKGENVTFYGKFNSLSNRYTHEKTVDVDLEYAAEVDDSDEIGEIVNEVLDTTEFESYMKDIRKEVEKIYYDACSYLYKELSNQWDWLHSEEAIIENLKSNGDVEFTADGKCFRPDIFDYPDYTITPLGEVQTTR